MACQRSIRVFIAAAFSICRPRHRRFRRSEELRHSHRLVACGPRLGRRRIDRSFRPRWPPPPQRPDRCKRPRRHVGIPARTGERNAARRRQRPFPRAQHHRDVVEPAGPRRALASLVVTNHPITGPVVSGPHQTPFVCEAQTFGLTTADADCSTNTKVDYFYRSTTANAFLALDPSAPLPADLAQTTTTEGATVPYIVRREMGTVNRAVYVIAFATSRGSRCPAPGAERPAGTTASSTASAESAAPDTTRALPSVA